MSVDVRNLPGNTSLPGIGWGFQIFRQEAMKRNLAHSYSNVYFAEKIDLNSHFQEKYPLANLLVSNGASDRCQSLYEIEDCLLGVSANDIFEITVAASTYEKAVELVTRFADGLPEPEVAEDDEVEISLWMWDSSGMQNHPRRINNFFAVPTWGEIRANYPEAINSRLDTLVGFKAENFNAGRVILLHGIPGTGKTHVVRALSREWKDWASVNYILDAETFFQNPVYMTELAFSLAGDQHVVFVVEDCGEFITADGASRGNQSLARLLNLADGILGQNLDLSIVMTTNEPIDTLHPALSRPGRCAAVIEFPAFEVVEANKWLVNHGMSNDISVRSTLADLYAKANPVI